MKTEFAAPPPRAAAPVRLPTLSRLPPLTALRAFVVAARYASFSRAADELYVSTTAIGQQVRILETHLGVTLFNRQRGELALTEAGSALYPGLAEAFETMVGSIADLLRTNSTPQLGIATCTSFAARWLAPRLGRINNALAGVEVSVAALETPYNDQLHREEADCAIVATEERLPGLIYEPLFDDAVVVVCSPDFAARHELFDAPERLRDISAAAIRGQETDPIFEWSKWLRSCGITWRFSATGARFSDQVSLIEAAVAGHGITLVRHSMVAEELNSGKLVSPFGSPQHNVSRYHLVTSQEKRQQPEIKTLLALLRETALALDAAA